MSLCDGRTCLCRRSLFRLPVLLFQWKFPAAAAGFPSHKLAFSVHVTGYFSRCLRPYRNRQRPGRLRNGSVRLYRAYVFFYITVCRNGDKKHVRTTRIVRTCFMVHYHKTAEKVHSCCIVTAVNPGIGSCWRKRWLNEKVMRKYVLSYISYGQWWQSGGQ